MSTWTAQLFEFLDLRDQGGDMRGWFLMLLGAGLGYLGWMQLARETPSEAAGEGGEVLAAPGRLRPASELLEAEISSGLAAEAGREDRPAPAVGDPGRPEPAGRAAREPGPGTRFGGGTADDLVTAWRFGDPVEQGHLLLHRTDDVPGYLERQTELSRTRRALVFAFACAIKGLAHQGREHLGAIEEAADVSRDELALLRRGLERGRLEPHEVRALLDRPLLLGTAMGLLAAQAAADQRDGRYAEAARAWSALLRAELDAPWEAERPALRDWAEKLHQAQAHHRWNRRGDWPSFEVEVRPGDSLIVIRRRVLAERDDLQLCTGLIDRANQIGGRPLHAGQKLRIPTERVHVLVDLGAFFALYMHGEEVVAAWEVAIGREDRTTPGVYLTGDKLPEPTWTRPGFRPVPYGSPENPLGTRWITWEGSNSLGFHGTSEPETIGTASSDGCVRMRNADVEELFEILPVGAEIVVRP